MNIDFEGLKNASQNGKITKQKEKEDYEKRKIEEEIKLNQNAKKECAELKKMFINIINNDVKEQLNTGLSFISIRKEVKIQALIEKNYSINWNQNKIINLSNLCDEFNYKSLIEPIEKKINIRFDYNTPSLLLTRTTHIEIIIHNNNV